MAITLEGGTQKGGGVIKLPSRLDTNAASTLKALLLEGGQGAQAGGITSPPLLDASDVEYVGGLCVQLLLASQCRLVSCSQNAEDAFKLFGVRDRLMEPLGEKEASHDK